MLQVPDIYLYEIRLVLVMYCVFCWLIATIIPTYSNISNKRCGCCILLFQIFSRPCLAKMFTTPKPCNFLIHSCSSSQFTIKKIIIIIIKVQQATLLLLSALFTKRNFFYKNQRNLFFNYKTITFNDFLNVSLDFWMMQEKLKKLPIGI